MMLFEGLILDHHRLGYLALWYGTATLVSGMILLTMPRRLRRFSQYIRLIHLMTGVVTTIFGVVAFLVAP